MLAIWTISKLAQKVSDANWGVITFNGPCNQVFFKHKQCF